MTLYPDAPPPAESLSITVQPQPNDLTCGPTCLQAIYAFYGDHVPLDTLIGEVRVTESGGTVAALLALHALERGYDVDLYTYNLHLFDPTWFTPPAPSLREKLKQQADVKQSPRLSSLTSIYLELLERGGRLHHEELNQTLLRRFLRRGLPILTGLSASYLWSTRREYEDEYDDVRGEPSGHFVVVKGYDVTTRTAILSDPFQHRPGFDGHDYPVPLARLVGAILLGVLTHDANFIVIRPRAEASPEGHQP